ncbi:MAG: pilin [Pseudomonadales bacterium]|nr:pilin [Pseudomonadales bacterium]
MHRPHGFTLIELMVVVAVIGLLAAVAVPAYTDYIIRSKIIEAIVLTGPCKARVIELSIRGESRETNQWGCEQNPLGDPSKAVSKYVKAIQVDNHGVVSIAIHGFGRDDLDNKVINFAPVNGQGNDVVMGQNFEPVVSLLCRTPPAAAHGFPLKYLPKTCIAY